MLTLPVSEFAVGDYSPVYGTITKIEVEGRRHLLTFTNGTEFYANADTEMEITQGGRFDHRTNEGGTDA